MRTRRAFSIVEVVVTMALVVLFTTAGLSAAAVASKMQAKASCSLQADNAAAEFCAAYERAYAEGAEGARLYNLVAQNISFSFGFSVASEYTEGAEHVFAQGEHYLALSVSETSYTFEYRSSSLSAQALTEGDALTVTVRCGVADDVVLREVLS